MIYSKAVAITKRSKKDTANHQLAKCSAVYCFSAFKVLLTDEICSHCMWAEE